MSEWHEHEAKAECVDLRQRVRELESACDLIEKREEVYQDRIAALDAKLTTHESAAKRWAEYVKLEESSLTGWYWASSEYPEDGYTGSYATEAEAIEAARECGYDDPETDTARIYVENMTTVRRELDARIADLEAKLAESEAINEILREQLAEAESPPEIRTRMGREANDDA